jgi:hypothetical protein
VIVLPNADGPGVRPDAGSGLSVYPDLFVSLPVAERHGEGGAERHGEGGAERHGEGGAERHGEGGAERHGIQRARGVVYPAAARVGESRRDERGEGGER